uniref:Kin of IRRE-like protein 3-like n=1 Tax=Saccoglossus kowalevskii TaxID=10224 RepID=A0ABM0LYX0_SACKO
TNPQLLLSLRVPSKSWEWFLQDGSNYIQIDSSDKYDIDAVEGDEQKTTLTVFDTQCVHNYRCQLGESYANIEFQATGSVFCQVLIGPTGIEYAKPGEDATLNCSIDWQSSSQPVNWVKVGESGALAEITDQGSTINVGDPAHYGIVYTAPYRYDLLIYNVDLEDDDGEYDCYFSLQGNADGEVGTLTVLDRIDSINIVGYSDDAVVTVDENEAREFTCESTDGNPAAELTWTIGGKDITEYSTYTTQVSDNNDKLHNSRSVLNYTFNASDNGEALKCQGFQHEDLTVRSARVYMNVKHIPIISGIGVTSWSDGGVINVECVDTANPDSYQYEWEAEGGQFGTTSENTWELTDTGDDGQEEITYEPTVNAITESPLKIETGSDALLECGTDAVPPFPENESWEWFLQDGPNYIQIDSSDEGYDIDPVEGDEQTTTLTVFDAQCVQTYRCQLGESYADIEVQATGSVTGNIVAFIIHRRLKRSFSKQSMSDSGDNYTTLSTMTKDAVHVYERPTLKTDENVEDTNYTSLSPETSNTKSTYE